MLRGITAGGLSVDVGTLVVVVVVAGDDVVELLVLVAVEIGVLSRTDGVAVLRLRVADVPMIESSAVRIRKALVLCSGMIRSVFAGSPPAASSNTATNREISSVIGVGPMTTSELVFSSTPIEST